MLSTLLHVAVIWLAVVIGVPSMKKLQPDGWKAYAVWAVVVAVIFTCFVTWYVSLGLIPRAEYSLPGVLH